MATGKVARRTVVSDVAELLDSPEISSLIADLEALRDTRGNKGYGARALVGACLVKTLLALPTWTRVAALIDEHPGLQAALGGSSSVWACYRFTTKLRANRPALAACLDACAVSLREQYPDIGRDVAIDASDLPAYANGQRFLYQDGPERERYSDPDASWGHRSAVSTRKGGGFYGHKIQAVVCTMTDLPLAWRIESARHNESKFVTPLLDALRTRGFKPQTCAMDKAYDHDRVYAECLERGCTPIIPLRKHRGRPNVAFIPYDTQRFRDLYRRRSAVEREFGRLKHDYGLAPLRVRGLDRVQLHADVTILGRLGQALIRARAVPLAA